MHPALGDLSPEQFLSEYWQKKPCLLRGALADYVPELDGDDLAGLACDDMAEARIVCGRYPDHDWQVHNGPFEEQAFAELPESHWTLLVQDVEKHYPPLQDLMQRFDFIPGWRLDDLMVSFAETGGSVGPHVDQYDVFLYQAQGKRLWQIAQQFDATPVADCPLRVLQNFEAEQEWVVHPGDVLYLPPGVAHHGVALEPGMTWSVGLRAPEAADLLMALGETLAALEDGGPRYGDADLQASSQAGEIDADAIGRFRRLLQASLPDDAGLGDFLGRYLTRYRLAHEPAAPPAIVDSKALLERLQKGAQVQRNPWTRLAWVRQHQDARLFAAGAVFDCSPALAQSLCRTPVEALFSSTTDGRDLATIVALINGGHLLLDSETEASE